MDSHLSFNSSSFLELVHYFSTSEIPTRKAIRRALSTQLTSSTGSRLAIFLVRDLSAQSLVFFTKGLRRVGSCNARLRCASAPMLHVKPPVCDLRSRYRAKACSLDRDSVARPQLGWNCGCHRAPQSDGLRVFPILMEQHLLFELRTVRASFGAQSVDAMHAVMAHPDSDL
jgi:hypothetical protein